MTISYNWLSEYLPEAVEPEKLSKILTSIGLEVESLERFEEVKGGFEGLIIGEVLTCEKHPNADKLSITTVNIGNDEPLQIVCGASNVAAGQKVIVATVGTTIYPKNAEPLTMRIAKIRSVESYGMICAEDEIGLSDNHEGILVLPEDVVVGTLAKDYFSNYQDWIFEIGLTPNRMDAMSHLGVAKDVCAYLSHHNKANTKAKLPYKNNLKFNKAEPSVEVIIENENDCLRYCGLTINNISVGPSPKWLVNKLKAIGVKSINNIVDITNFILHETGQPLHAFDKRKISNNQIIVTNLEAKTNFVTLDEKERKLQATDLMICDGTKKPLCIAGVYGGLYSGVNKSTTDIFLESAVFASSTIRKTSLHHALRTDAATRFEKGVDIGNTLNVLKHAAALIIEVCGGELVGDFIDVYPKPNEKKSVVLKYHYLKKLSGKNYHPDAVIKILESLDFEIAKNGLDEIHVLVPYNKTDISIPADIVEEIIRIDGLDNIEIPNNIHLSPAINPFTDKEKLIQKISAFLVGQGFQEILTNSITNSNYYSDEILEHSVKMLNSLTVELNIMRPSLLETGLETIAFNSNRKNNQLQFFEFGKTYHQYKPNQYEEVEHLSLLLTGNYFENEWREKTKQNDFYRTKGISQALLQICGIADFKIEIDKNDSLCFHIIYGKIKIGKIVIVSKKILQKFNLKQSVYQIDFNFIQLLQANTNQKVVYKEVSKYPSVQRDLALILDKEISYEKVDALTKKQQIPLLQHTKVFDVFESEKLGNNKKSIAINYTFLNEQKTLTDEEIDGMMNKLIKCYEKELQAEIRKS
ncbi:MAG: phenylalanine--tRNA ligase subunit beta [Chitinophagaceae bacterium]|nr:phenylalanine--tRNA ligase subunit beta [Chitinophagaceae bacterium]